jgi:signal transduction histidine kinase
MFLNPTKGLFRGLRFRIAFTYFVLVVVSSIILFGFLYYLLAGTLREKDQQIITSDFKKFSLLVTASGRAGLVDWFARKQNLSSAGDLFVRLVDVDGHVLFSHEPGILREMNTDVFQRSIDKALDDVITRVESPIDAEDAVEFYTDHLKNGMKLQVGKDSDDREELLERFRRAFLLILFGALVSAIATAVIFSTKMLRPIQNLIGTVETVRRGDLTARATVQPSGDEINELAKFLNGMLEQNSKLIGALTESLDAVAHDLRTPLTRLRVYAERALQSGKAEPEALGAILENTDQVIELLNSILDVSEAEAGTLRMRLEPLNLRQVVGNIVDVYSVVAEDRGISLSAVQVDDRVIRADIRIKQAIANLIDNGIKFSPPGSVVQISTEFHPGRVSIFVTDDGPGIGEDERPKIWERLYRGELSRTTRGMGLGLSLVRSIVLAHGGSVSVRPARANGTGSIFEISLPLV